MTRDPEGGHYASPYVDIAGGTYEGQLVIGQGGFIHPVKDFKVTRDEEVVILQFSMESGDSGGKNIPIYLMVCLLTLLSNDHLLMQT